MIWLHYTALYSAAVLCHYSHCGSLPFTIFFLFFFTLDTNYYQLHILVHLVFLYQSTYVYKGQKWVFILTWIVFSQETFKTSRWADTLDKFVIKKKLWRNFVLEKIYLQQKDEFWIFYYPTKWGKEKRKKKSSFIVMSWIRSPPPFFALFMQSR